MIPLCARCGHGSDQHVAPAETSALYYRCRRCSCDDYRAPESPVPAVRIPGWKPSKEVQGEENLSHSRPVGPFMVRTQNYIRDPDYVEPKPPVPDQYILVWSIDEKCLICQRDQFNNSYSQVAIVSNEQIARQVVDSLNQEWRERQV